MAISLIEFLSRSPATSQEIQSATDLSQSVVSRQLNTLGNKVVRIREGRSIRYHLTQNAFGADDRIPIFTMDAQGLNEVISYLRPLVHGTFFIEPCTEMPSVLLGEKGNGFYDDLPYFLEDLRPNGFLGRQVARKLSETSSDFPTDPRYWTTEQVGRYLISNGDDLSGNFQLGLQAHLRTRQAPVTICPDDYPSCAEAVIRGEMPGSSAGGEQPKFTAYNQDCGHVIVKFSPAGDSRIAKRWRDILITEYHATAILLSHKFPAAEVRLFEKGNRLFLESKRFDRNGTSGRMSLISMQAVDAEFTGAGSNWVAVMNALNNLKLVNREDVKTVEKLWSFGRLINNTDMHLGNLSLSVENDLFRLLPIYDMCSMGFAPRAGEVTFPNFSLPALEGEVSLSSNEVNIIRDMAEDFWDEIMNDDRISEDLRDHLGVVNK